jgi:drug/metabolite transporter (DMT)-like permease
MSYKAKIALVVTIFLWASGFVGIRAGLQGYSPEGLALLRFLIASVCMAIIYFSMPKKNVIRVQDVFALMGVGVVGIGIYNITLNYGELSISSGMASFIISQAPILTAFFVSVFGVTLIAFGEKGGFKWDLSVMYVFIATLSAGLYSIMQKPFLKRYHAIEATTYIIWGATIFLCFYFPKLQQDLTHATLKTTLAVVYLGIFPAAIAYLAWSYALAEIPVSLAASFLYFMPFVATLLGWMCLGEVPVWLSLLGGIFAIIGVWLVNQSYQTQVTVEGRVD